MKSSFWGRVGVRLFPAAWLPLYVLVGISWLLAPALTHEHYGSLQLISNEEAMRGMGVWYRAGDIVAALILLLAVLRFRVVTRSRYAGWGLVVVAVLSMVDGLFPDLCYVGHEQCSSAAVFISVVHDMETLVLGGVIAALSIADTVRRGKLANYGFVGLQLVAATLVVSGVASQQFRVVLQYAYEFATIVWLGWYVDGFNAFRPAGQSVRTLRRIAGASVLLAGVFALVAALPHAHFVHDSAVLRIAHSNFWLDQHGIIAGILLLYVSRHLLRGERPALWLVLVVLASLLLKYGVFTPQPIGIVVFALLFVSLLYVRSSFDRNVEAPSWTSRLEDVGVVFGGVLAAVTIALLVVTLVGQRPRLVEEINDAYGSYHAISSREDRRHEHAEARLRVGFETLLVTLGAVSLWSLFRPKSFGPHAAGHGMEVRSMRELLERFSTSSEDYFKIWPEDKAYFAAHGGAIAYRVEGGIAFMLADPIAATGKARALLLKDFTAFARTRGWVVCALLVGEASRAMYEVAGMRTMQIGSSAVIPVAEFQAQTARDKWWRWQRNRASKSGWHYEALRPPHSRETLKSLRQVSDAWLTREDRSEQGFALGYFDETYLQHCTVHVLRNESGNVIAFANQLPVFGTVRQATVDLIRFVPDASGAMPALLLHIIENFDPEKTKTFDLGFVPLAKVDNDLAQLVRRLGSHRFASLGLEQFKNKFRPDWQPEYIAYDGDLLDLARIAANLEKLFAVDAAQAERVQ